MRNPEFVYKIASREAFESSLAAGRFAGMPIDLKDGYVHFSTAGQLAETLKLHFAGQRDLIVFAVRCYDVGAALRWEPSRGGQLFPHLYSELPMSAVTSQASVAVGADGTVTLPEWVQ
ncbi:MAG: DUF952 domain-containing protein [Devosia sp.]